MRLRFWTFKAPEYKPPYVPPAQAEGEMARARTEESVASVRETRKEVAPMLAWLRRDYERNHYADALDTVFRGGRS